MDSQLTLFSMSQRQGRCIGRGLNVNVSELQKNGRGADRQKFSSVSKIRVTYRQKVGRCRISEVVSIS